MTEHSPAVMEFLLSRRSRPAKMLGTPIPDRAQLETLLTAAARVPDHGKLEPWRFIVLEKPALERLAALATARGTALGFDPDRIEKGVSQYAGADLVVAVVASPKPSDSIPAIEQTLSAGAVCLSLVNAALASGWGACWLTGWAAHDRAFVTEGLDLSPAEFVAGMIHLGTEARKPPERPRPDLTAITRWVSD